MTSPIQLLPLPDVAISQQQRWGGVDRRKKRPRNPSREDASLDGMEHDADHSGDMEPKVIFCISSHDTHVTLLAIGVQRACNTVTDSTIVVVAHVSAAKV